MMGDASHCHGALLEEPSVAIGADVSEPVGEGAPGSVLGASEMDETLAATSFADAHIFSGRAPRT